MNKTYDDIRAEAATRKQKRTTILRRADARTLIDEAERTMGHFEHFQDWRKQISYYRDQLAKLPEQRRTVPIWTPITKIGRKSRKLLDARGVQKTEIDGVLHYAISSKETPTRTFERQIDDAEQAAEAGDIGRFGLHIAAIVTSLLNAQIPTIRQAHESARQQKVAQAPRNTRKILRRVLDAMDYTDANDAVEQWRQQIPLDGFTLEYRPAADEPFIVNGESFTEKQVRNKVSKIK